MTAKERREVPPEEKRADPPPAQIKFLYASRDGKLCLFEDAQGHLTAVRASKLV